MSPSASSLCLPRATASKALLRESRSSRRTPSLASPSARFARPSKSSGSPASSSAIQVPARRSEATSSGARCGGSSPSSVRRRSRAAPGSSGRSPTDVPTATASPSTRDHRASSSLTASSSAMAIAATRGRFPRNLLPSWANGVSSPGSTSRSCRASAGAQKSSPSRSARRHQARPRRRSSPASASESGSPAASGCTATSTARSSLVSSRSHRTSASSLASTASTLAVGTSSVARPAATVTSCSSPSAAARRARHASTFGRRATRNERAFTSAPAFFVGTSKMKRWIPETHRATSEAPPAAIGRSRSARSRACCLSKRGFMVGAGGIAFTG